MHTQTHIINKLEFWNSARVIECWSQTVWLWSLKECLWHQTLLHNDLFPLNSEALLAIPLSVLFCCYPKGNLGTECSLLSKGQGQNGQLQHPSRSHWVWPLAYQKLAFLLLSHFKLCSCPHIAIICHCTKFRILCTVPFTVLILIFTSELHVVMAAGPEIVPHPLQ